MSPVIAYATMPLAPKDQLTIARELRDIRLRTWGLLKKPKPKCRNSIGRPAGVKPAWNVAICDCCHH